jgi:hypothetical protein
MKIKIGDTLRIADCESMRYSSGGYRVGKVTEIDQEGRIYGSWGDFSIAESDDFDIVDYPQETVNSFLIAHNLENEKRNTYGQKRETLEKEWSKAIDNIVPCVGLPCTICYYSDKRAATVTQISSEKKIEVTHNVVKTIDYYAGDYEVLPDLMPRTDIFTKRRNGQWVMEGQSVRDGVVLMLHYQRHYIDPSF